MSIFDWFKRLHPVKPPVSDVDQAKELAHRIAEKADSLQRKLSRYKLAKDPSVALFADVYNARQVSRIYHGLNGKHHG